MPTGEGVEIDSSGLAPQTERRSAAGVSPADRGDAKEQRRAHWDRIYRSKRPVEVSWFQEHAERSLELIGHAAMTVGSKGQIIDVGGGTSTLADDLLDRGYRHITVLDVSATAVECAKERLGQRAAHVEWVVADVTSVDLPRGHYDIWHDRAVFHFLTEPRDRVLYIRTLSAALKPGATVIIATFAADGPTQCSGLEVVRYSPEALAAELGCDFRPVETSEEVHRTPSGGQQKFVYCRFVYVPEARESAG